MTFNIPAPYSQEAEEAVLGSLLIDPESIKLIWDTLKPEDFYLLRHQYIYGAALEIARRGEVVDYITLLNELRARRQLDDIGGAGYLTQLINLTPTSIHVEAYAGVVRSASSRRRLLVASDEIKLLAINEEITIDQVEAEAYKRLEGADLAQGRRGPVTMYEMVNAQLDYLEATQALQNGVTGLETGFEEYDQIVDGFQPGSLNVLAGRPGMGKTAGMVATAVHVAENIGPVLYWTGEMPAQQISQRISAVYLDIEAWKLRRGLRPGGMSQSEWRDYLARADKLSKLPIYIDDTPSISPMKLQTAARRLAAQLGGLALIVVDYLQLMRAGFSKQSREQEVAYISGMLKETAKDIAPVLAGAQVNRECENRRDKRPIMSDLRESGAIEQDSDTITFLYRDWVYNPASDEHSAEWIVAKNRHGGIGTAHLYWDPPRMKFQNGKRQSINLNEL